MKLTLWNVNLIIWKKIWKITYNSTLSDFYFKNKRKPTTDEFIKEYHLHVENDNKMREEFMKKIRELCKQYKYIPFNDTSYFSLIPN